MFEDYKKKIISIASGNFRYSYNVDIYVLM
jgi:hypothetical protein